MKQYTSLKMTKKELVEFKTNLKDENFRGSMSILYSPEQVKEVENFQFKRPPSLWRVLFVSGIVASGLFFTFLIFTWIASVFFGYSPIGVNP
jgi:hypothetical protein